MTQPLIRDYRKYLWLINNKGIKIKKRRKYFIREPIDNAKTIVYLFPILILSYAFRLLIIYKKVHWRPFVPRLHWILCGCITDSSSSERCIKILHWWVCKWLRKYQIWFEYSNIVCYWLTVFVCARIHVVVVKIFILNEKPPPARSELSRKQLMKYQKF